MCLICFSVWQYEYKANDVHPVNPHKNKLICWEYMPPHKRQDSPPSIPRPAHSAVVDVRTVTQKAASVVEAAPTVVSSAVVSVCGLNASTADRYEARNDALRSIARERHLPTNDVTALVHWLASTNDVLRVERLAALKNDVMNLLRNQEPPPPDLADTLASMFESGDHPPAVLDYCIQHLGAMQGDVTDDALRRRIRALFAKAAGRVKQPYAGTALYALAEDGSATLAQEAMVALYRDRTQDDITRDFAVQHIGLYAQALNRSGAYDPDSEDARLCRDALLAATAETKTIIAAAAFRALSDVSAFDPYIDGKRLDAILVSCVGDASASSAARIMAIQLCGERRVSSALPALKGILDDATAPIPHRHAAKWALSRLTGDSQ